MRNYQAETEKAGCSSLFSCELALRMLDGTQGMTRIEALWVCTVVYSTKTSLYNLVGVLLFAGWISHCQRDRETLAESSLPIRVRTLDLGPSRVYCTTNPGYGRVPYLLYMQAGKRERQDWRLAQEDILL